MDDTRQHLLNLSEAALKYGSSKIHFLKKKTKKKINKSNSNFRQQTKADESLEPDDTLLSTTHHD